MSRAAESIKKEGKKIFGKLMKFTVCILVSVV